MSARRSGIRAFALHTRPGSPRSSAPSSRRAAALAVAIALLLLCTGVYAQPLPQPPPGPDGSGGVASPSRACPVGTILDPSDGTCAYHLGLVFPYGEFLSKAARVVGAYLAVHHINSRNASVVPDAAMLPPEFKVVPTLLDSKFSPAGGVNAGLEARKAGVIAVVGAARSSASIPLSHVMVTSGTPVVSYASTSATLSSIGTFPYFARTIPTDTEISRTLARLMINEFGWTRVGMLYVDDSYGSSFYSDFVASCRRVALDSGMASDGYEVRGEAIGISQEVAMISMRSLRDAGFRVFALVLLDDSIPLFLRAAAKLGMIGKGYTYITVDSDISEVVKSPAAYGVAVDEAEGFNQMLQGMLRVYLDPLKEPQYTILDRAAAEIGASLVPQHFKDAIAAQVGEEGVEEWFMQGMRRDIFAMYAYDAVWSVALALRRAEQNVPTWLQESCGELINCHAEELTQLIRSGSFQGGSGLVQFSPLSSFARAMHLYSGDRDASGMETPLQFYNWTSRSWITCGTVTEAGLVMSRPVAWPGQPQGYIGPPDDGASCEAGSYFDEATLSCKKCSPGWYSSRKGLSKCQKCEPGTFCGKDGCTGCYSCEVNTYQPGTNATSCLPCPDKTVTNGRGMSSLDSCHCREQAYRRDRKPGKACFECPEGAYCKGGSHEPYAKPGFWGDWTLVETSVVDSEEAAKAISRSAFHVCATKRYCTSNWTKHDHDDYVMALADDPEGMTSLAIAQLDGESQLLHQELTRLVRQNVSRICSAETRGRMCVQCSLDYFSLGGKCLPCMKPYGLFVVGCVLAIITVWYLINRFAASRYEAVDLMLLYFQNASTLSTYSLNWHPWLIAGPFWVLSIVNFDVDFFKPDCLSTATYSAWSFGHSLILQLMLPVLVVLGCSANYGLGKLCTSFIHHRAKRLSEDDGDAPDLLSNMLLSPPLWVLILRKMGFATTPEELDRTYDQAISTSTSFCSVIYHTLTLKCLEVFITMGLPDHTHFMVTDPSMTTDTTQYKAFVAISVLGLLAYTIGFPIYCFVVLEYGRLHNLFREERFSRRYGWLFLRYEREWYYWELVILARRAGLVLVILANAVPSLQIWFGLTVIVATMTMHFYARPFIDDSLDVLETASLVGLIGLMMTGILFYDTEGPKQFQSWDLGVVIIVCFFLFGALALVTVMVINDIWNEETMKRVARRLQQDMQKVLDLYSPTGNSSTSGNFRRSLLTAGRQSIDNIVVLTKSLRGHALHRTPSSDSKSPPALQSEDHDKVRRGMRYRMNAARLMEEDLEVHRTLDVHRIDGWLYMRKTQAGRSGWRGMMRVQPESGDGGLDAESGRAEKQLGLELPLEHQLGVLRLWLVNHWMRELMSDTSPVSYFSNGIHAQFFGHLVGENPYIIDYFLGLPENKLDRARETIRDLRKAQLHYTRKGRLARLVCNVDRGPMLAWLMVAPYKNIQILRCLLEDLEAKDGRIQAGEPSAMPDAESGDGSNHEIPLSFLDKMIYAITPDPRRLGITRRPTIPHARVPLPGTEAEGNASASPPLPQKGNKLQGVISAATKQNLHSGTPTNTIASMDEQIRKLGRFNSDLAQFLQGIEAKIVAHASPAGADGGDGDSDTPLTSRSAPDGQHQGSTARAESRPLPGTKLNPLIPRSESSQRTAAAEEGDGDGGEISACLNTGQHEDLAPLLKIHPHGARAESASSSPKRVVFLPSGGAATYSSGGSPK